MGQEHLDGQFALLQNEAAERWPDAARENGLLVGEPAAAARPCDGSHSRSLTRLSQLFVQVFLVGHDVVNLPQASDIIQGYKSTTDKLAVLGCPNGQAVPTDPAQLQAAAARGLKTKIRRLYDIANVFLAVGLLVRCEPAKSGGGGGENGRRPHYQWNYRKSIREIREQVWPQLTAEQKRDQTPFDEVQTEAMERVGLNPKQYVYQTPSTNTLLGKGSQKKKKKKRAASPAGSSNTKPSSTKQGDVQKMSAEAVMAKVAVEEKPPTSPGKPGARRVSLPVEGERPTLVQKHCSV